MSQTFVDYAFVPGTDTYSFGAREFLSTSHVHVYTSDFSAGTGLVETVDFTTTGGSGTLSIVLGATIMAALETGDNVRIRRITPVDVPLVDFQPGSLRSDDLDTANLQALYAVEESGELVSLAGAMVKAGTIPDIWVGEGIRITDLSDGTGAQDAVTKSQLDAVVLAGSGLPLPGADNDFLVGASGAFSTKNASESRTALGLGTAATRDLGTGSGQIPTVSVGDSRWSANSDNLSALTSASDARTNLGLGTAAVEDVGVTSGDVVQLGASGLPAVGGSLVDLTGHPSLAFLPTGFLKAQFSAAVWAGWSRSGAASKDFSDVTFLDASVAMDTVDVKSFNSSAAVTGSGGSTALKHTIALPAGYHKITVVLELQGAVNSAKACDVLTTPQVSQDDGATYAVSGTWGYTPNESNIIGYITGDTSEAVMVQKANTVVVNQGIHLSAGGPGGSGNDYFEVILHNGIQSNANLVIIGGYVLVEHLGL